MEAHGLKKMNMDDYFRNGRFLIVDDFEQMRVSIKGMLSGFGAIHIQTASTGEQALKCLAKERFDVVVCDYNLGEGKDGQQVLEEARYLGYLGHASTFFMVTAETHMPMVLGALEHQPDEYMVKPINREAFQLRLVGTLNRKKKLKPIDEALMVGDKARAIDCCMGQVNGDLKHAHYLSKLRAELCVDTRSYEDAEKIYKGLLEIRDFPWANFGLGKIDFFKKDLDRAESRFMDLIKKNQHYLEAYDWAARVKEEREQVEEAQQLLQQAVKMAPKSVARQRKLGILALKNGDSETAERAFRAAIRWGKNSCFAGSKEYLELADIYRQKGQQTKQLQLLADGASRFGNQPVEQVQLLCKQAAVKHGVNIQNDIEPCLIKIIGLAEGHSAEMPAGMLSGVAEECYRLAKPDYARELLKTLLGNYHDDATRVDEVRQIMQKYEKSGEVDKLIEGATRHLVAIQSQCTELIGAGEIVQAIDRLNDAADRHPGNRTLALMGVKTMIDHMTQQGLDQGYYFRCRRSLDYLLQINADDLDANNALQRLSGISPA